MIKSSINPRLILLFPLLMILLAIIGGFVGYSAIPVWDSWNSNVNLINKIYDGNISALWEQHFEHRILLTKLLAWLNYVLFDGFNWFLVIINYVLLGLVALLTLKIKRDFLSRSSVSKQDQFFLCCFLVAWLFQWMQNDTLLWDVCSQILLTQLLPLAAFYWLHKSTTEADKSISFIIATLFGVASVFSMANGLLALPLMIGYSILTRQKLARICLLSLLFAVIFVLYFHNLHQPKNHSSVLQSLIQHPVEMLQYSLHYIGSPFYHLLGDSRIGRLAAEIGGVVFIVITTFATYQALRRPQNNTLLFALVLYLIYFLASALGTAGGRLIFGVDHALWTTRYATSALMAWSILIIIYYEQILKFVNDRKINIVIPLALLVLLMIAQQFKALKSADDLFSRDIAALSVVMGIDDTDSIHPIFHSAETLIPIAEKAYQNKISIFGVYPFSEIRKNMGGVLPPPPVKGCATTLNSIELVKNNLKYARIGGLVAIDDFKKRPTLLRFSNQGQVVGYALLSWPHDAKSKNFTGYILLEDKSSEANAYIKNLSCDMLYDEIYR